MAKRCIKRVSGKRCEEMTLPGSNYRAGHQPDASLSPRLREIGRYHPAANSSRSFGYTFCRR